MFVSKNQFYVFISCISFGLVGGVLYSPFSALKFVLKNNALKIIVDTVYFIIVSALFSVYAFLMYFPTLRIYMLIGVLLGLLLYFKSFHIILAKLMKKFYNITKNIFLKVEHDGIKSKKNDRCIDGRRGSSSSVPVIGFDISIDSNRQTRKRACGFKRKNRIIPSNDRRR